MLGDRVVYLRASQSMCGVEDSLVPCTDESAYAVVATPVPSTCIANRVAIEVHAPSPIAAFPHPALRPALPSACCSCRRVLGMPCRRCVLVLGSRGRPCRTCRRGTSQHRARSFRSRPDQDRSCSRGAVAVPGRPSSRARSVPASQASPPAVLMPAGHEGCRHGLTARGVAGLIPRDRRQGGRETGRQGDRQGGQGDRETGRE